MSLALSSSLTLSCSASPTSLLRPAGKGVQMQRDVQCCMLYSQGKVRTKDVLRFEVQTEGPDCSIQAIMQVFQISNSRSCGGAWQPAGSENITSCLVEGGGGGNGLSSFQVMLLLWQGPRLQLPRK